ncbi:nucleoid-associated protein [Avibacterium paragallinarum]|uniref:nucleoid-associated protein n=1 Tax=Avibacterium paragallinarum TaxID=728 RepID=UPI00188DE19B|nr:nucleoid-associated protein [Avibacterium paragallinarum]
MNRNNIDLNDAIATKLVVHRVGNKFRDEGILFSDSLVDIDADLNSTIINFFLSSTLHEGEEYIFTHESDINLNVVRHYSSAIFNDKNSFLSSSEAIAKYLYACSTHPNIGGGELIEILFEGAKINNQHTQAIGLFKIESKVKYWDVNNKNGALQIIEKQGIEVRNIQKGVVIFPDDSVFVIDKLGKKTKYWIEDFIKSVPKETDQRYQKIISNIAKAVYRKIDNSEAALYFSGTLQEQEEISIRDLRVISDKVLDNSSTFNSIIAGINAKYNMEVNENFSIHREGMSTEINKITKRVILSQGLGLEISDSNIKVLSIDKVNSDNGFKLIINIEEVV